MLRILHGADLHLDSPFGGLSPEEAKICRDRQRTLPGQLAELCRSRNCDLLLLAGDVFDGEARPETVEALKNALADCGAEVFIAPGNHDPYTAASPWVTAAWPENVHIFSGEMDCVSLPELQCRVWGAAFRESDAYDLLRPIPKSNDGWLEVGVFHGDPVNRGGYHYIAPETLAACGLDYLALGHIHAAFMPRQAGNTFYGWPGTAMGRGFDELGEKGAFCIRLDKDRCEAEFLPLQAPRYEIYRCPAEELLIPPALEGSICRLILTGESDGVDLEALHRELSGRFLHLQLRDETVAKRDLWEGCGEQTLKGLTLADLRRQFDGAQTEEEKQTVLLAVRYALAALEGREQP